MKVIALLRGVTPTGKNRIPKMNYLVEILENAGFSQVKTYIQSGNIILDTELTMKETSTKIHEIILKNIGADLSVIVKTNEEIKVAISENPFDDHFDYSRIHMVFTNDEIDKDKLLKVHEVELFGEILQEARECFYMYLPVDAIKKKLNTNFLEKRLGITGTMRKMNVIQKLYDRMDEC